LYIVLHCPELDFRGSVVWTSKYL